MIFVKLRANRLLMNLFIPQTGSSRNAGVIPRPRRGCGEVLVTPRLRSF